MQVEHTLEESIRAIEEEARRLNSTQSNTVDSLDAACGPAPLRVRGTFCVTVTGNGDMKVLEGNHLAVITFGGENTFGNTFEMVGGMEGAVDRFAMAAALQDLAKRILQGVD